MEINKKSLTEIANYYGSDKGTDGPSFYYGGHNYTDLYESYLSHLRLDKINVLEIGIGVNGEKWKSYIAHGKNKDGGASIKMLYDYFPNAQIYCIDINPASFLDNDRIKSYVVDQGNLESLTNFISSVGNVYFDFIIDDGSHRPDHQQLSFSILFPLLKPGGIYFIEDLENNGLGDFQHARNNGRHKNTDVYSTRKIFKHLSKFGTLLKTNKFTNEEYILSNINDIKFHSPRLASLFNIAYNRIVGRILNKNGTGLEFIKDSENLLAILKKH